MCCPPALVVLSSDALLRDLRELAVPRQRPVLAGLAGFHPRIGFLAPCMPRVVAGWDGRWTSLRSAMGSLVGYGRALLWRSWRSGPARAVARRRMRRGACAPSLAAASPTPAPGGSTHRTRGPLCAGILAAAPDRACDRCARWSRAYRCWCRICKVRSALEAFTSVLHVAEFVSFLLAIAVVLVVAVVCVWRCWSTSQNGDTDRVGAAAGYGQRPTAATTPLLVALSVPIVALPVLLVLCARYVVKLEHLSPSRVSEAGCGIPADSSAYAADMTGRLTKPRGPNAWSASHVLLLSDLDI